MRILLSPDDFKGTLSADDAARAIATGWRAKRLSDDVLVKPLSDGGPGFVAAIAASRAVATRTTTTVHALGGAVEAQWCLAGDTAYLEAAQVLGLDRGTDIWHATSCGLADVLADALAAGAHRIVVGLGGTCVNDGGAGMLEGLGAIATARAGQPLAVSGDVTQLAMAGAIDLAPARGLFREVALVAATDVDVPLLGPRGATHGLAKQKGATAEDLPMLEDALAAFAAACARREDGKDASVMLGAGAAGGVGFALLALGATRESGFDTVWRESEIDLAGVDLVITGEGRLDWQSMRGKVVSGVAKRAQQAGVPVLAIAGDVTITPRERSEMGLDAAYSLTEWFGAERAVQEPAQCLAEAATRLVRTWGRLE